MADDQVTPLWVRIRPWVGFVTLILGLVAFAWELYGKLVHVQHLWASLLVALFGAWCLDAPGADSFVTLVLRVVPWVPRAGGQRAEDALAPNTITVQVPVSKGTPPETPATLENPGPVSNVTKDPSGLG